MDHKKAIELYEEIVFNSKKRTIKKALIVISKIFAVLCILVGALFLAPSITGRVIDGMQKHTANTLGVILFVLGLIVYYFVSKNR